VIGHSNVTTALRRHGRPLLVCAAAALMLTGCGDARKIVGLDRSTPDEFAVVPHQPLTLPPDLRSLPAPTPGAPRPQEPSPAEVAQTQLFKGKGKPVTADAGGKALVAAAGPIDPDVRRKVNEETTDMISRDRSWLDGLLFWQKREDPYTVVNPKKEQERVRQAEAEGKSPAEGVSDAGVVPTIERKKKAPLEGLF
jgi:hypothetical protein